MKFVHAGRRVFQTAGWRRCQANGGCSRCRRHHPGPARIQRGSPGENPRSSREAFIRTGGLRWDPTGTLGVVSAGAPDSPIGTLSHRDVAILCVAGELDPDVTPISKIMSQSLRAIDQNATVEDAIVRMAEAEARRLVVTGAKGKLVGILSLDDVIQTFVDQIAPIGRSSLRNSPTGARFLVTPSPETLKTGRTAATQDNAAERGPM
jgi:CBS domain-containing protein